MRAATVENGEILVREHPDPEPGLGEVLVRVRAAGINGADLLQRAGLYPAPPGSPADIPGLELAGEVVGLGPGVSRYGIGDRVMAIVGGGGQAEMAVIHERVALPIPESVTWEQAGGFPEAFVTAHDARKVSVRVCERLRGRLGGWVDSTWAFAGRDIADQNDDCTDTRHQRSHPADGVKDRK